jgi:putative transposase
MIDRTHDLPISRQAKALNISRGAVYYKPRPVSPKDLRLMRRIDELHLERPFAGARMLRDFLDREGITVGRRHVATLMKRMGIEAIYRRPNASKPTPARPQDLPVSAAGRDGRAAEPSLGDGHNVHPDVARLRLSCRRRRLVQPARAFTSGVDHDGGRLLRRGARGGPRQARQA